MPSLSSRSEVTLAGAALAALVIGLYAAIPGPPKPLKDRLKGPDASLGERDKVMDLEVYGEQGWWWSDQEMPLALLNPARIPYFVHHLGGPPSAGTTDAKYVDVGCGGGIATEALAKLGFPVVGVDPSEGAIEQAQKHAQEQGLANVHYRVGSADSLPFASGSIDGVVSSDVLEHLDDLHAALAEIHRVLKPGGVFVFDTINRTPFSWYTTILVAQEWLGILPRDAHDWRLYITPKELQSGLIQAGFDVAGVDTGAHREGAEALPPVPPGWIGMGPTMHGPLSGMRRMFFERRGFSGWVGAWEQKVPHWMHGKNVGGGQAQSRRSLMGMLTAKWDTDASYLGWATKRA